eukprot:6212547-Pleurochrysis_carterae.AAC.1
MGVRGVSTTLYIILCPPENAYDTFSNQIARLGAVACLKRVVVVFIASSSRASCGACARRRGMLCAFWMFPAPVSSLRLHNLNLI